MSQPLETVRWSAGIAYTGVPSRFCVLEVCGNQKEHVYNFIERNEAMIGRET